MPATTATRYTLVEVLRPYWWVGVVSLCVALGATPVFRWIAYRAKVVDRPDDLLKPHGRPVAYLGGVGIYIGLLAGLIGYAAALRDRGEQWARLSGSLSGLRIGELLDNPLWNLFGIAAASLVIMLVGLLDDLVNLRPRRKLAGQVLAAGVLMAGGVGVRMAKAVVSWLPLAPPDVVIVAASAALCVLIVIATCNATNLIDGLDGLCGGVTGIIALGFLMLAAHLATYPEPAGTETNSLRIALCLAMVGAVLGFLPYNVPPASIFMGDAGSMLLGFFVATEMALFCKEGTARWFLAACGMFALPILDTALAVVRRRLSGKSIFEGDRSHLYDQLVDRGMSVKQVVVLFYGLALAAGGIAVGLAMVRVRYALLVYALLLTIVWVIFYKMGMLRPASRHRPAGPPAGDSQGEGP